MTTITSKSTEIVKFSQYDKPAMEAGLYELKIEQKFKPTSKVAEEKSTTTLKFAVEGERFTISPEYIHARFPPAENLGNYADTLPHISFKNSTFPWERSAYNDKDSATTADNYEPWLALLVFHEDEAEGEQLRHGTISLKDRLKPLPGKGTYQVKFPETKLGPGQKPEHPISVIDVQKELLAKIIPPVKDLFLVAHVRERTDTEGKNPSDKLGVVVANRLPQSGGRNTAHLVSLEERYSSDGTFNYQSAADSDYIRLVSLHTWSFTCLPESNETLEELLKQLDSGTIGCRKAKDTPAGELAELTRYFDLGYSPMKHHVRQGSKTISWYRGPLVSKAPESVQSLTGEIRDSDALYRFNQTDGMFDTSYAMAFELGRLMALDSKTFTKNLYNWKREQKQKRLSSIDAADDEGFHKCDLPIKQAYAPADTNDTDEVKVIGKWFDDLNLLKGVPFNYLVPDESMLPVESIRFFTLDRYWVDCLMRGAFSIGRVTSTDADAETQLLQKVYQNDYASTTVSGFLLRSQMVAGWPDLVVEGYAEKYDHTKPLPSVANPLEMLKPADEPSEDQRILAQVGSKKQRIQRLSSDVMLCLFKGEVGTVEIYEPPEALHFGIDEQDDTVDGKEVKTFTKDVVQSDKTKVTVTVPLDQTTRVIHMDGLRTNIKDKCAPKTNKPFTSANFGRRMLEGEDKGRYVRG